MLMGQFEDGMEFIEKSFELDPGRVLTKGAITHWLTVYGRLVEAVEIGHEVVAAFPDYAQGRAALIRAYVYLGMIDEAESLLAHAQEFLHENHSISDAANAMLLRTGNYDALDEFARQGFERLDTSVGDPLNLGQVQAIREYGRSLLRQGRNEAASEVLHWGAGGEDGISKTTYDYMNSLKLLALSYQRLDRHEEAAILIDQCLGLTETAHENGWATPNLFYRLAEIYAIKGDVSNAVAYLETAFERGWRDIGILEYGIFWESLQDDPAINSVKVEIYNDLEAQKRTLLEKSIDTANLRRIELPLMYALH
jgi:tetratricopeptide (TPR) repeat protein